MSELPNSIREVGESKFTKLLVYAMWGAGKTVFVGSGGPRSLILRPPTDHTDSIIAHYPSAQRPKEWVLNDWDEANTAGEYLRLHGHEWDWVTLDSISLFQEIGLDDIWSATKDKNPSRDVKWAGKDKKEYGLNMDRLAEWVRNIVSLDAFNFCITAFPTLKFESPESDTVKMMPWIQGKQMAPKICGYMNMVGCMEVKRPPSGKVYRQITFQETDDFYAKDQFNAFPDFRLVNPTLPKIAAAVAASRGKAAPVGGKRRVAVVPSSGKKRTT